MLSAHGAYESFFKLMHGGGGGEATTLGYSDHVQCCEQKNSESAIMNDHSTGINNSTRHLKAQNFFLTCLLSL